MTPDALSARGTGGTASTDEEFSPPAPVGRLGRTARVFAVLVPVLVVLVVAGLAYDGVRRARESAASVQHTRDVVDAARKTRNDVSDAETGQRGYLLAGDARYLAPYERAVASLRADTSALRRLTRDNPAQQRRLDALALPLGEKLAELAETIALRRTAGLAAATAVVRSDRGRIAMDSLRAHLAAIERNERELLAQRAADEQAHGRTVVVILVAGAIVAALVSLLLGGVLLRAATVERRLAIAVGERSAQLQRQGLQLELQSRQLQEQAREMEAQNEELQAANAAMATRTREAMEARTAAETANRTKSEFLAMMSHELRTPLNAIAGYAQLMQLGVPVPAPSEHQDYIARIQRSQQHLLGLINSVLNIARIESGRVEYLLEEVEVGALLAAAEQLVAPQLRARGHRYECGVPGGLAVRADPEKVLQVVLNLLSNAIKFTPAGGEVAVTAEALGGPAGVDMIAIRVRDSGPGIDVAKREAVFEPFVQVDSGLTRATDGTGLGLAISRELARGMGGDLVVEAERRSGATLLLTLPRADVAPDGARRVA